MAIVSRRGLLIGGAGVAGLVLAGCSRGSTPVTATAARVQEVEDRRRAGRPAVVTARLDARPAAVDLGGRVVSTWTYAGALPGPLLRARAGQVLDVELRNALPAGTSVHWHGVALRNDMDGVPGMTQAPVPAGGTFRYEFVVPDPGTYFYHPHVGVQLDRGLAGVLLVDDPHEAGDYDAEWVVVLDDWIDGTGQTPDEVLRSLGATDGGSAEHNMDGMGGMGGMGGTSSFNSPLLGGAGDIDYPYYLLNGRLPQDPDVLQARPGQRVRIRIVNAGSDTAFRVALAGHQLRVTHADGFPVQPHQTDAVLIAMGERLDVEVTLADGIFPLVAAPEGKSGIARGLVRTGAGRPPAAQARPAELDGRVLLGVDLRPASAAALAPREPDVVHDLVLAGTMSPYRWTINGKAFPDTGSLPVREGQRVRLRLLNHSMMFHPMHVHGHTFAVRGTGIRKDTVIVKPMQTLEIDFDADNPGQWMTHCHNIYHAERGMMITLSYQN